MTKDDIIKLAAASYDQGVADAKQEALAALEQIVAAARADERDKLQSAAEWCRMCERKGVFHEKATGDEANSPKVLGEG